MNICCSSCHKYFQDLSKTGFQFPTDDRQLRFVLLKKNSTNGRSIKSAVLCGVVISRVIKYFTRLFSRLANLGAVGIKDTTCALTSAMSSVIKKLCLIWKILSMNSANEIILKFARLTEHALPPIKGSDKAAGYDLKSAYDYTVPARGKELVKTDLQIELPSGCYGRIAPRSGLAWKNFIDVGAGVIDEDYRGNVGVVLFNHSDQEFKIQKGDRVAQLICERIFHPVLKEIQNLSETDRGEKGFGSSGIQ